MTGPIIILGDARTELQGIPDASIDSIVTDPPYELGFMGKTWDASGVAYDVELWAECLRVLKPGGHLLAFGGTRTYHRMTVAIEDAGFEIRDSVHWIYGSGFPKSLDVSKAIDKAAGAVREVVGSVKTRDLSRHGGEIKGDMLVGVSRGSAEVDITAPATDAAREWSGWGTALKPAHEPIVVARKPLVGTVAANVLAHGTGAINVDACRVGETVETWPKSRSYGRGSEIAFTSTSGEVKRAQPTGEAPGRWPANIVLAHAPDCADTCTEGCPVAEMDRQGGGASRFFPVFRYQAKAPTSERPVGPDGTKHATVKPLTLMRWLVRLVTPPGGTVLDPFAGSGTTIEAALLEGLRPIGIEYEAAHLPLIQARIDRAAIEGDNQ